MSAGIDVIFWRDCNGRSPVYEEFEDGVGHPSGRMKVDHVLSLMAVLGFRAPGLRVEKVKGTWAKLFELKISSCGEEHRFLASFAPGRNEDGRGVLVLLKYVNKKRPRLDRGDIDTAQRRAWSVIGELE